jgi:hypothetical protein
MRNCDEAPMNTSRTMSIVRRVHDNVELAWWSALLAVMICVMAFIVPNLPEAARSAESARAFKAAQDNRFYCEKWGFKRGTREHALCTTDLYELRKQIEQEFADEAGIF